MSAKPAYDDGLDADGYAVVHDGWRFIHGCEKDAGDFRPVHIGEAAGTALERIHNVMNLSPGCDSPIEAQLGAAVLMFFERAGVRLKLCKSFDANNAPEGLLFVPQFKWSFYRSDWAIVSARTYGAMLIECDGKDFHSSPAQKSHDSKKDAAALDYGFLTMRFTGSAIFRDADGCAQKIYDALNGG
jgi:very-short-patch-repair endonuclease